MTGLAGGTYVVVVKDENGCSGTETIVLDSRLGIIKSELINLTVYPNPTIDLISISLDQPFTYSVNSINGDVLMTGNSVGTEELSLIDLAAGTYLILVQTDNKSNVIKLIKD